MAVTVTTQSATGSARFAEGTFHITYDATRDTASRSSGICIWGISSQRCPPADEAPVHLPAVTDRYTFVQHPTRAGCDEDAASSTYPADDVLLTHCALGV